jgi:hypothetical protein
MPFRNINVSPTTNEWLVHLFDAKNSYCDYATACMCPCIEINDIARMIISENVSPSHGLSYITSCVTSLVVDIPLCFCCEINRSRIIHELELYSDHQREIEDEDDTWDPHTSSFDWWPISWCWFYTLAAFENCCSTICCGPTIRTSSYPLAYGICISLIYPFCMCPVSFILRQAAKEKLHIRGESCLSTCVQGTCCMPCSFVQVKKTLTYGIPKYVNTMT